MLEGHSYFVTLKCPCRWKLIPILLP
jgi:hypothetical protein